jgi:hypothetical protein
MTEADDQPSVNVLLRAHPVVHYTIKCTVNGHLEEAVDRLMKGIRDPEVMRQAAEEMDAALEELRNQHGEVKIAVDLVRESREEP